MRVTGLAEQATLSALLLDPPALARIATWLRPTDFADPWHAEIYTTIKCLAAAGRARGAAEVGREYLDWVGPARADLPRIAGLVRVAPPHADPRTYAVMVLEDSLRRDVLAQGVLLRAAALSAVLEGTARPIQTVTGFVDDTLHGAAVRWAEATGDRPESRRRFVGVPRALASASVRADDALGADRLLRAHPEPAPVDVAEREAALIAVLIARPDQIRHVVDWLRPPAVTNRQWRPIYEATIRLYENRSPIDAVTVLWETQRTSRSTGRGPEPALVNARVDAATTLNPALLTYQVAGDHLRLAADAAARGLNTAVANPGLGIQDLLDTGHALAAALRVGAAPLDRDEPAAPATSDIANVRRLEAVAGRPAGPVAG